MLAPPFVVGEADCDACGERCCEHCWLDTPRGARCIICALVLAGVRGRRRGRHRAREVAPPAPIATLTWSESAELVDLRPVLAARRDTPDRDDELVTARPA